MIINRDVGMQFDLLWFADLLLVDVSVIIHNLIISADPSRKLGERAGEECSGDRQKDRQTDRQAGRQTGGQYGLLAAGPIRTSCHGVLALRDRPLSGALPAVQEGGRMEGLRLVSIGL